MKNLGSSIPYLSAIPEPTETVFSFGGASSVDFYETKEHAEDVGRGYC